MDKIGVISILGGEGRVQQAVAACRAGSRVFFNAEDFSSLDQFQADVFETLKFCESAEIGLLIGQTQESLLEAIISSEISGICILIAHEPGVKFAKLVTKLSKADCCFGVQVVDTKTGIKACAAGADFIILKGSESGGYVGDQTAFVLTQDWARVGGDAYSDIPFYTQGGIGIDTASSVIIAGASGFVLDAQLLLARESALNEIDRKWIESTDGSEVVNVTNFNILPRPGVAGKAPADLSLFDSSNSMVVGQDVALAASLADQFVTIGGIISNLTELALENIKLAAKQDHLNEGSALAQSHGTQFPVLQGPMTRVSDTAEFATAVAANGGLPFLALAVLRGKQVDKLITETKQQIGDRSWGVGLLGFLPPAVRAEQTEVVLKHKPPFAIIAGGRPDQAKQLEDEGISTYLHVPSPGLLESFLKQGAKKFIFEGRECGGHVGPRSSFVLWQSACDILIREFEKKPIKGLEVVFAGGIHDEISGSMVAALSARLAEQGIKVGLLMGTAYLFTEEAVACGAIVDRFQKEAINCDETVLLQTGPGHAIRCVKTPYYEVFESEKQKLLDEGASHEELVRKLEGMNIGRLRVASKGVDRKKTEGSATRELVEVPEQEQFDQGMYMIGQVAALESEVLNMMQLHQRITVDASKLLREKADELGSFSKVQVINEYSKPSDIAIIGMSCFYPDANDLDEYWDNILDKHYAVREIPETHWDWRLFYDEDPKSKDRIVSKWGGFLKDIDFDPLEYGITPKSMEAIEPLQLLTLQAVNHALDDAGYSKRPFNRERTACIVGIGGGAGPKSVAYGFRTCMRLADYFEDMPIYSDEIIEKAGNVLPEWTEDSFPGFLSNICSGRVANRFDLGGSNYAIDAACASSLASLDICVRELEMGTADMAIAMGADAVQTPFSYMAFSKTHALSKQGHSKPFDAEGDGIVLSEGVGVVVLKRLEDAERDGDKIYSVIKGVGSSSDGKAKGLTAPNASGQARALHRAYHKANVSPAEVGLIEAHGTGTVVGDQTEANALSAVLKESGADLQSCALGSVKSMIGHSKCAAGIAGVIKTSLALHHKIIPPTLVDEPNPNAKFAESSLYLNKDSRPWVQDPDSDRIAGVSAFGFGGTNFHAVLSEYKGAASTPDSTRKTWTQELFVWRGSNEDIAKEVRALLPKLNNKGSSLKLGRLARAINRKVDFVDETASTLVIIVSTAEQLAKKLEAIISKVAAGGVFEEPNGTSFTLASPKPAKIGFLFPGQGSQYPNMLADLAVNFDSVRKSLDLAESVVGDRLEKPLNQTIYPASSFSDQTANQQIRDLAESDVAQPAIGACSIGLSALLQEFGVTCDMAAGHSYGEYAALHQAGVLNEEQLYELSYNRGKIVKKKADSDSGMLAVKAGREVVESIIDGEELVYVSNINSPTQTVLSVANSRIKEVETLFADKDIKCVRLSVATGFHSPFLGDAGKAFAKKITKTPFSKATIPVYSNSTGKSYPDKVSKQKALLQEHLTSNVDFVGMIKSMLNDGAELLIEAGPSSVLSGLCQQIAPDVKTIACDAKGGDGLKHWLKVLGKLCSLGVAVNLDQLYHGRAIAIESVDKVLKVESNTGSWVINGVRSRRVDQPEPLLLGQPHPNLVKSNGVDKVLQSRELKAKTQTNQPTSQPVAEPKEVVKSNPPNKAIPNRSTQQTLPIQNQTQMRDLTKVEEPLATSQPQNLPQGADHVMMGFQNLMSQFLDTQKSVMCAYLGGESVSGPVNLPNVVQPQQAIPAPSTAAPISSNGNGNGSSNGNGRPVDLAVTTPTNRVESVIESQSSVGQGSNGSNGHGSNGKNNNGSNGNGSVAAAEVKVAESVAAPVSSSDISIDEVKAQLLAIVGERTGYPEDMLDLDLDLEADLGIDSIKRVEILGELAEFIMPNANAMEDDSGLDLEKLSGLRTLQQILDYLDEFLETQKDEASDVKKKSKV